MKRNLLFFCPTAYMTHAASIKRFCICLFFLFGFLSMYSQEYKIRNFYTIRGERVDIDKVGADDQGNFYICGKSTGEVDLDLMSGQYLTPENSYRDVFIAKYNLDTEAFQWGISLDNNSSHDIDDLKVDSEGNVYVLGRYTGTVDFDPSDNEMELTGFGETHTFIGKYDNQGNLIWVHKFGNGNFDVFPNSLYLQNNKVIIHGINSGDTDFDPGPGDAIIGGSFTDYILELTTDGDFIWVSGITGNIQVSDSELDEEGNLYLVGKFFGSVNFDFYGDYPSMATGFGGDAFVAKYNDNYEIEWIKEYTSSGFSDTEDIRTVGLKSNGNVVIVGSTAGTTDIEGTSVSGDVFFASEYDPNGESISVQELFTRDVFVLDLFIDENDRMNIHGLVNNSFDVDPGSGEVILEKVDGLDNRFLVTLDPDFGYLFADIVSGGINDASMVMLQDKFLVSAMSYNEGGQLLYDRDTDLSVSDEQDAFFHTFFFNEGPAVEDNDGDGFDSSVDCDDSDASINPDATEIPYNGIDEDCNDATPDDDLDGDGYNLADDCDDDNAAVNPEATEEPYNGIDDDCNDATLDDDLDGDGFELAEDCDDDNEAINPAATEIPYNGVDEDCDDMTLDDDLDGDGFNLADDCNDEDAAVNPDATEVAYNGIDDDCNDATVDDDLDGDGFLLVDDCDDTNPDIYPGAPEILDNEVDEDCDGVDASPVYEIGDALLEIFPNPAHEFIQIKVEGRLNYKATMYSLTGKVIFTEVNTDRLDVSQLAVGIYHVEITDLDTQQKVVERIMVSK